MMGFLYECHVKFLRKHLLSLTNEGVPAVDVKTRAAVVVEHRVAQGEAPDVLQMNAVAREMADAAVVNGGGVVIGHERDPPWHLTIFGAMCSFFVHYGIIARGLQGVFDK
jgi:hypothetical protein